jgi:hypothetical protein
MTTVDNSFPSRFRPQALLLGGLLRGYDTRESTNFPSPKYRGLGFQFLILLSTANCLVAQGSPTVVRPGLNLAKTIHNLWGKYAVTRNGNVGSL